MLLARNLVLILRMLSSKRLKENVEWACQLSTTF